MDEESDNHRQERVEQIAGMFMLLTWLTKRRYERALMEHGMTFAQYMALSALSQHPTRCKMSDLVNVSPHQEPAAMTGVVDRLVRQGWVERRRSETDRRVVLVTITDSGKAMIEALHKQFMAMGSALHEDSSDEELDFAWKMARRYVIKEMERYGWIRPGETDKGMRIVEQFMQDPVAFAKDKGVRS